MYRHIVWIGCVILSACTSGQPDAEGPVRNACLASDRAGSNPALCSCLQRAANDSFRPWEHNRAAELLLNPDLAHDTRFSDNDEKEAFWKRYRAFTSRAQSVCS